MNNSKVSIITPAYNAQKYIEATIISVLKQTYQEWEIIIINDNSKDKTYEIIEYYAKHDTRIKVLNNTQNLGAAKSRNRGIQKATGKYISFLDSDDLWLPHKLEKQITLMQKESVLMSYASYYIIDELGTKTGLYHAPTKVSYSEMLKTSSIGTLTTIYDAEILGKFYFEKIGHEDYAMKLKILKRIPFAKGITEPLAHYRVVKKSLSSNKLSTAKWQWHIYRKVEKISLLQSIYYFIHYAYHGFFKYR